MKKITTDETFAVKRFSKKDINHDQIDTIQSLKREIATLRSLNHESIVKIIEVQETENSLYIIFEHLKGGRIIPTRSSRAEREISKIRKIIFSILSVLRHLKSENIVHRDIKPENILFKDKECNEIKLIDFGLAVSTHEDTDRISGTPGFMAPELFYKDTQNWDLMNSKVDVFSLGVILHFYLFGKWVFEGRNSEEIFETNCTGRVVIMGVEDMRTDEKDLDAYDLMKKMLEVDQGRRISIEGALAHPFFRALGKDEGSDGEIEGDVDNGNENFLDEDHLGFADFGFLGTGMRRSAFISGLKEKFEG